MTAHLIESALSPALLADPLSGLLVACDLKQITLRLDGDGFMARPAAALDPETKALLREHKPHILNYLRLSPDGQRTVLLLSYELVLWAISQQVQAIGAQQGWQSVACLAGLKGLEMARERYEALHGREGAK